MGLLCYISYAHDYNYEKNGITKVQPTYHFCDLLDQTSVIKLISGIQNTKQATVYNCIFIVYGYIQKLSCDFTKETITYGQKKRCQFFFFVIIYSPGLLFYLYRALALSSNQIPSTFMDPPEKEDRSPRSKSIANICRSYAGLTKKQKQICRRSPDVTEAAIKVKLQVTFLLVLCVDEMGLTREGEGCPKG